MVVPDQGDRGEEVSGDGPPDRRGGVCGTARRVQQNTSGPHEQQPLLRGYTDVCGIYIVTGFQGQWSKPRHWESFSLYRIRA